MDCKTGEKAGDKKYGALDAHPSLATDREASVSVCKIPEWKPTGRRACGNAFRGFVVHANNYPVLSRLEVF
jgi:hypothetical protein